MRMISFILIWILLLLSLIFLFSFWRKYRNLQKQWYCFHQEMNRDYLQTLSKLIHEFKNPLAVCLGYFEMLDFKEEEKTKRYLKIIENEIKKTVDLMNGYMQQGKIKVDKEVLDINLVLEEVIDTFQPLFQKEDIVYQISSAQEENFVFGDYEKLKQVFINLIKNAIEARKEEEKLHLSFSIQQRKEQIETILQDDGWGMSKDTLEKVGTPFFTTKRCGNGLGVSLCHEIIEKHSGKLSYKAKEGIGTTVIVSIPRYNGI